MGKLTAQYEDRIATRERKTIKKHATRNQIERFVFLRVHVILIFVGGEGKFILLS